MIHEYLSHGAHNAISAEELGKLIGISDHRKIRSIAERERLAGVVILSDEGGYYLPNEDKELAVMEVTQWIAARTAAAGSIMKTVEKAREYLKSGDFRA